MPGVAGGGRGVAGKMSMFERGLPGIKHGGPSSGRGVAGEWPGARHARTGRIRENPEGGRGVARDPGSIGPKSGQNGKFQFLGPKKKCYKRIWGETNPYVCSGGTKLV